MDRRPVRIGPGPTHTTAGANLADVRRPLASFAALWYAPARRRCALPGDLALRGYAVTLEPDLAAGTFGASTLCGAPAAYSVSLPRMLRIERHPVPVDRAAVERAWRARGFSCGLWVDPPGQEWIDFVHDTDELVRVVEGEIELTVGGESAVLRPGEEAFIPARALHSVKNVGGTTARWLYGYAK